MLWRDVCLSVCHTRVLCRRSPSSSNQQLNDWIVTRGLYLSSTKYRTHNFRDPCQGALDGTFGKAMNSHRDAIVRYKPWDRDRTRTETYICPILDGRSTRRSFAVTLRVTNLSHRLLRLQDRISTVASHDLSSIAELVPVPHETIRFHLWTWSYLIVDFKRQLLVRMSVGFTVRQLCRRL